MRAKNSKIIFFDIDGTLIDITGIISAKLMEALKQLKINGHEICIATGRSEDGQIMKFREMGWDGYVLGNGVYGEYQGKLVMHETISEGDIREFLEFTKNMTEMGIILEGNTGAYVTKAGSQVAYQAMQKAAYYGQMAYEDFISYFQIVEDLQVIKEVNKLMYFGGSQYINAMLERFGDRLSFLPNSITQSASLDEGEMMKKGISKAKGIQQLIATAGYEQKDVIAFGDGYNDIEMIEFADIGIAMGNGVNALKEKADIVADRIEADGIVKTLKSLALI